MVRIFPDGRLKKSPSKRGNLFYAGVRLDQWGRAELTFAEGQRRGKIEQYLFSLSAFSSLRGGNDGRHDHHSGRMVPGPSGYSPDIDPVAGRRPDEHAVRFAGCRCRSHGLRALAVPDIVSAEGLEINRHAALFFRSAVPVLRARILKGGQGGSSPFLRLAATSARDTESDPNAQRRPPLRGAKA